MTEKMNPRDQQPRPMLLTNETGERLHLFMTIPNPDSPMAEQTRLSDVVLGPGEALYTMVYRDHEFVLRLASEVKPVDVETFYGGPLAHSMDQMK